MSMIAPIILAFVALEPHITDDTRKDDYKSHHNDHGASNGPRMEWILLRIKETGKIEQTKCGIYEHYEPAAAFLGREMNSEVADYVIWVHGLSLVAGWPVPYTCSLRGFSGSVEKMASMGSPK